MSDEPGGRHGSDPRGGEGPDCTEALKELYWFLDGEVTTARRSIIRRHLDDCHDCLEAYDFEAELRAVISTCCGRDPVPDHLRARIAAVLEDLGQELT
ncbi:MAG: mycothiol system anti-sigma-R factor [Acidimicrobiales bacterium]